MNKIVTSGPRRLVGDRWHDDSGPLPDSPLEWDPPMTDDEIRAAALADPDAQPIPADRLARMRHRMLARFARDKARMSQEEFASVFKVPIDELRAWEAGQAVPPAMQAYLTVIAADPGSVVVALTKAHLEAAE